MYCTGYAVTAQAMQGYAAVQQGKAMNATAWQFLALQGEGMASYSVGKVVQWHGIVWPGCA